jgi:hypothetical protein
MTDYVAYTPIEGEWHFTRSETRAAAIQKLLDAITWRRVLVVPVVGNLISTVIASDSALNVRPDIAERDQHEPTDQEDGCGRSAVPDHCR